MATTDVWRSISALDLMPAEHNPQGRDKKRVIKKKKEERKKKKEGAVGCRAQGAGRQADAQPCYQMERPRKRNLTAEF